MFVDTLKKMDFDFKRLTECDEPFFGIVPGKAAYPMGQVSLPVTFCMEGTSARSTSASRSLTSSHPTTPSYVVLCWPGSWPSRTTPT
jgi:hypothetical protein